MGDPALIQILRKPPAPSPAASPAPREADDRCEFCGAPIEPAHGHLVNVVARSILCVCRPCHLLFSQAGAGGRRFRAVPDRYLRLDADRLVETHAWAALDVPIGLAFFLTNSTNGRTTAFYPSPAGAIESELPLDGWQDLRAADAALGSLEPDVEALLVRRPLNEPHAEAFVVPVDVCYELAGVIRQSWRGVQGGDALWASVDELFTRVRGRAGQALR